MAVAATKKLVGVGVEASTSYGRQVMRGVMRYANIHRQWLLAEEFNIYAADVNAWPQCDGAILTEAEVSRIQEFEKKCKYLVCCTGGVENYAVPTVSMDDVAIGQLAAQHLVDCNLQRFAVYSWKMMGVAKKRLQGFREGLQAHGFSCELCPILFDWARHLDRNTSLYHWPRLIDWLQALPKPIGIFALDDMIAHDLTAACLKAEIHVPDQIAIIGVNNDDLLCESSWPPISSVQCDFQRVGYAAAELLDRLMSGESLTPEESTIRLQPVGVVKRTSTDSFAVENSDLAAALVYIREHCCDPCSVEDVLRHVPVGRRALERMFSENLGHSPYEEITRGRIKRAQELLIVSDLSILEIAKACGFADTSNFNRQFRRFVNEAPASYRRARKTKV